MLLLHSCVAYFFLSIKTGSISVHSYADNSCKILTTLLVVMAALLVTRWLIISSLYKNSFDKGNPFICIYVGLPLNKTIIPLKKALYGENVNYGFQLQKLYD